jgi:hypothetical protein
MLWSCQAAGLQYPLRFSAAAGVISGDFILRLPLDDFWPSVHLAPWLRVGNVLRRRCRSIKISPTSCFLGMSIPRFRRRLFLPF